MNLSPRNATDLQRASTVNDKTSHWPSLRWRHNGRDAVSNHQPRDCLLNRLFRRRSKKTSTLRATGLCSGNSPATGEFPAQMASNAEKASISWRHYVTRQSVDIAQSRIRAVVETRGGHIYYHWIAEWMKFSLIACEICIALDACYTCVEPCFSNIYWQINLANESI